MTPNSAELVTIFQTQNPMEANMIRGLLESAHFDAFVFDESLPSLYLGVAIVSGVRVMVPSDQRVDAELFLAAIPS